MCTIQTLEAEPGVQKVLKQLCCDAGPKDRFFYKREKVYWISQILFKINISHIYSQLIIQRAVQVKMIDESKRSLRVRKNPKYLNSDEQDPDKVSFAQLKSHHDYSSSRDQKAQDAKILVKLIQNANKSYKAYLNELGPNATEAQKHELAQKDKKGDIAQESSKKTVISSKQSKKEQAQKTKPLYNIKPQPQQKEQQISKSAETNFSQLKQQSSMQQISGIGKGIFTDQLKKLQSLYPDMKNITYQSLTQNINPNLFSGAPVQNKKDTQQKSVFAEEKLFKRSAYHVAIAYHIYLKNLKEKGGVIGNEIDPTYYAKKLKDYGRRE